MQTAFSPGRRQSYTNQEDTELDYCAWVQNILGGVYGKFIALIARPKGTSLFVFAAYTCNIMKDILE